MNENSIKSLFKRSGNGKVVTMGYFSESQALDFYTLNLSDEIPIEKMGMTWISGIDASNRDLLIHQTLLTYLRFLIGNRPCITLIPFTCLYIPYPHLTYLILYIHGQSVHPYDNLAD